MIFVRQENTKVVCDGMLRELKMVSPTGIERINIIMI